MSKKKLLGSYLAASLFAFILMEMSSWFILLSGPMGCLKLLCLGAANIYSENLDGVWIFSLGAIGFSLAAFAGWLLGFYLCLFSVKSNHSGFAIVMISLIWIPLGFVNAFFIGLTGL